MRTIVFAFLLLISCIASAELTVEQKTVLKAAALAEPSIAPCIANGNDVCVADWFNSASTFVVWRTELAEAEIKENDAFAFNLIDLLAAGKRDEWTNFLFRTGYCNPSKLNIRNGIADVWSGTAAKNAVQTMILELAKRFANNAEKLLATGVGINADPGVLVFEGGISVNDVSSILRP